MRKLCGVLFVATTIVTSILLSIFFWCAAPMSPFWAAVFTILLIGAAALAIESMCEASKSP